MFGKEKKVHDPAAQNGVVQHQDVGAPKNLASAPSSKSIGQICWAVSS